MKKSFIISLFLFFGPLLAGAGTPPDFRLNCDFRAHGVQDSVEGSLRVDAYGPNQIFGILTDGRDEARVSCVDAAVLGGQGIRCQGVWLFDQGQAEVSVRLTSIYIPMISVKPAASLYHEESYSGFCFPKQEGPQNLRRLTFSR
jgi:hypothetical protein